MKAVHSLSVVLLSSVLVSMFPAYSQAQKAAESLKTFTAPDGTFSFRHSGELTDCLSKPGQNPPKNCVAYFPMCSSDAQGITVIACLAYPRNKYTNTEEFEAATFSVGIAKAETEKECIEPSGDGHQRQQTAVSAHGVTFRASEGGEGHMSQSHSWRVYNTFHNGKCYHLAVEWAMANPGVFDPPAKEITKEGWADIDRQLEEPRKSFRFLK